MLTNYVISNGAMNVIMANARLVLLAHFGTRRQVTTHDMYCLAPQVKTQLLRWFRVSRHLFFNRFCLSLMPFCLISRICLAACLYLFCSSSIWWRNSIIPLSESQHLTFQGGFVLLVTMRFPKTLRILRSRETESTGQ